jgi:hypothetical protein
MSTSTAETGHQTCGLRFNTSEAPKLQALADRVKAADLRADASTFEQAAFAAETGEPLVVHFTDPNEVLFMIAGYVRHGIVQPAIEELNGSFASR